MAFDFPTSPAVNQLYTSGGMTYKWNGYGWLRQAVTLVPGVVVSDSQPITPVDGMLWYRSTDCVMFIRYNDGSGSQWVEA